ncbi:exonuclease domain-containing protein [uncultured Gemmiger sp.]|uniref:exonuclease domain-containing protein n=1 Tax=uncultured Gemmiger sp. TaxID=1623490 RepID=UPI0025F5AA97|nr:exonuclease domain-containing protein [uncultured Gemmiger sp.]
MKPFVTQVWPQFTADAQFNACFGQVLVDRVELYRTARKVVICLRSAEPLDGAMCGRLFASLEPVFEGYELTLKNYFNYGNITPEAARTLIEELKHEGLPVNGFLDKSPISIEPDGITVHVAAGMNILESIDFPRRLAERIQERTGTLPIVRMVASGKTVSAEEFEKYVQNKTPAVKFEAKKDLPPIQVQGLDLTDKPVKVFHGKYFKPADLRPLNDLGDGGKITVWGDVFASEVKGNRRKIYFTSITDYTGSVSVKMLGDEGEDMSKWESIKPGTTFIIRGDYSYDKYEHDYVLYPYDILQVERRQRQDEAPEGEKRVELHLHTKSSSMDGFCDPGKIVRLAHSMGHRAIAITDHGVCQGYPEAMLATDAIHETDPDFKLIYGCEAYFVDDMIPAVYGPADQPLTGSFVVFDTETTGLNANTEALTEIGAVYVENGHITDKTFCTFVNPGKPIPARVVELTGINDAMVADAPTPEEAIRQFKEFCGESILVAHNANGFDMLFIRKAGEKAGVRFDNTYLDTLPMAQALFPGLHNYKLDTINKHLEIPPFNHHRAVDDAMALARIFEKMLEDLEEKDIHSVAAVNTGLGGNKEVLKKKYYHLIILVKNQIGLKNLYRIVSAAHTKYFFKKPRVPRSLLNQYREGLLLSSACEAGELYRAVVAGKSHDELLKIADYYDFLEVQPLGNNEFMVRNGQVDSIEKVMEFNRTVIQLGEELHKPVIATGDVHFQEPEDSIYRAVLQAGNGFKDADHQAPLYYRTTPDMLDAFGYLPKEKAYEIVVKNPNKIAATIHGKPQAIPQGTYPPAL